ncbi:hypothetical protein ACFO7M_03765 [Flavobacterium sp. GCM10023249]
MKEFLKKLKNLFRSNKRYIVLVLLCLIGLKYYTNYIYKRAFAECKSSLQNESNSDIDIVKDNVFKKLNQRVYDSLFMYDGPKKTFMYAIVVSNKYNYNEASFEIFHTLANLNADNKFKRIPDLNFLDKKTRNMALFYLEKSANENNPNAKFILGKYYISGEYHDKNVDLANKLLKDALKLSGGVLK